jgi:hypothetical protein
MMTRAAPSRLPLFLTCSAMDTKRENPAPICPHCAESMRLALTIPSGDALPELHNYYCRECGVIVLRRTEWRRAA